MKAPLLKYWESTRDSYWFLPSLMALGAIALATLLTPAGGLVDAGGIAQNDWLRVSDPNGARALLSTLAGSMITVAGVTFSIAIAAVAYTASQYGPRLLNNFMQDRGNQFTLGIFIATFLYCLLVLRTIQGDGGAEGIYIPHLALLVGVALALCSIGVLIYFIHHVPAFIHVSNMIARAGNDLHGQIAALFPGTIGYDPPDREDYDPQADLPDDFLACSAPVRADAVGYVQHIDEAGLMRTALQHDLVLRLEYRPGDFVSAGKAFVYAWPAGRVDEAVYERIRGAFASGRQRTPRQDPLFLVNELVEIAARAISPAINEPFTAMHCLDWLASALISLAQRDLPDAHRYDAEGRLRVIARPVTFEAFAEAALEALRPYVQADRNVALHQMKIIGEIACEIERPEYTRLLLRHARALRDGCCETLLLEADRTAVEARYRVVVRLLNGHGDRRALTAAYPWLGGRG